MMQTIICHNIHKTYQTEELQETVLNNVYLEVNTGESCILLGPSGSGKTTLLSIMGCLLTPSKGYLRIMGKTIDFSNNEECLRVRRNHLGFVFQQSQLLPFLTIEQNVMLAGQNAGLSDEQAYQDCQNLFRQLDISQMSHKKPGILSGGQKQRAAVCRALIHKPQIVLADEPTAALDWNHGQVVIDLLIEQTRKLGASLIVVCHDQRLVSRFDRVFNIENGQVTEQ